ncbi:MAG: hypothetical protein C0603_11810 [Denitrovibrio sp.]|nr:MAG: hypothetical protein C0603_11810 [Denitrovibrio sp.]
MDNTEELTPSEIIMFRAECYKVGDGGGVFSLYSIKSDVRKIFTEKAFSDNFKLLTKDSEHAGIKIVSENIKKSLAEVKYIEHFNENGELRTFYSKTFLIKEADVWRILKEKREIKIG